MIDESAAVLPSWILISAARGFIVGEAVGDQAVCTGISGKQTMIFANNFRLLGLTHQICNRNYSAALHH